MAKDSTGLRVGGVFLASPLRSAVRDRWERRQRTPARCVVSALSRAPDPSLRSMTRGRAAIHRGWRQGNERLEACGGGSGDLALDSRSSPGNDRLLITLERLLPPVLTPRLRGRATPKGLDPARTRYAAAQKHVVSACGGRRETKPDLQCTDGGSCGHSPRRGAVPSRGSDRGAAVLRRLTIARHGIWITARGLHGGAAGTGLALRFEPGPAVGAGRPIS